MNRIANLLAPAALALALAGCTNASSDESPADAVVSVRVTPVVRANLALPVTGTGTLTPKDAAELSFKLAGVVARVNVEEGDRVRAGQPLASLQLGDIDPAVARARATADKAERDQQRVARLYADSVATLSQLQDATTAWDAARAEYEAARFNRGHAEIVAPADGVVLRRLAEPGELVDAGRSVLEFAGRARGQIVRLGLADRDFVRVEEGDSASVWFDAYPGRTFAGVITERGASADPVTGTYRVELSLPDARTLASGLVGRVEIRPRATSPVALVPVESLLEADGDHAWVYTLSPDGRHAVRRAVELAFLAGGRAAIRSGLEGVGAVISEGNARLDGGDRVEVLP